MSLQVWLPLNGNLENQGLSSEATISGIDSYITTGKISNKSFNGSNWLSIFVPTIKGTKVCTFAFWAYVVGSSITSDWTLVARIDEQGTNSGSNMRFEICPSSRYNGVYCFSNHNNTSFGLTTGVITSPPGGYYNRWVHFCFTSDGTTFTRYMDGVKIGTCPYNGPATFNGGFNIVNSHLCYRQDVRIYDHCLSEKEVKELAKGLVLHYRLAGPGQENLIKDSQLPIFDYGGGGAWCTFTKSIVDDNGLCCRFDCTATGVGGKYYYPDGIDITTWAGQVFTWSFEAKANRNIIFQAGHERGGVTAITVTPQWTTFSKTWTFTSSGNYAFVMYPDINISVGDWFEIRNIKIEKGSVATPWCPNPTDALYTALGYSTSVEYDCSGYKHNGIPVSTTVRPTWDVDSPRYTTSFNYSGDANQANYTTSKDMNFIDNFSWAIWIKPNYVSGHNSYVFTGGRADAGGYGYGLQVANATSCTIFYGDNGRYSINAKSGEWHHVAFTKSGTTCKCYLDGSLVSTNTFSGTNPTYSDGNGVGIGCFHYFGNIYPYFGKASDLRIYATTLSDTDIAELYHSAVIVDNTGKNYAYEYFEA